MHECNYIDADRCTEDFALLTTEYGFTYMNMDFSTPYPYYECLTKYFHGWAAFESFNGKVRLLFQLCGTMHFSSTMAWLTETLV